VAVRLRLHYGKTGGAKYISHLDLMASMRRAFLRAGLELKYSEGFNPHPYISVALPLPVGCASVCELLDFEIAEARPRESIQRLISPVLPEGLTAYEIYAPERSFSKIAWVEICGRFIYDSGIPSGITERLTECFTAESVIVQKKTKRGISDVDITSFIRDIVIRNDDAVTMTVKVSAQNPSISHTMLMDALSGECGELTPGHASFTRMELYDSDMIVFR